MIKPEFYFLGWDNFSSYLNLESTTYNTLFDTWREHRGLGVPSDAEINDIFRQIFYVLATALGASAQILDQLYFACMLWGGVLSMYGLGRYIARRIGQDTGQQELFGFLAAFFYLFNLSTMSVFYYPMIMFVTRFFMLPTLVYVLLKLVYDGVASKKRYLFYLALVLIGFGTHMVPTNFIVLCMALGLGLLILDNKKRVFLAMAFVLALGMYWMLPFVNYTLQKGDIVPNAPLFIQINEATLNKPKEYFSFENQAKMRPNFFDIEYTEISSGEQRELHQLASSSDSGRERMLLWIFPILYLAGIGYVLLFKRDRVLVWMAVTTVVFLLLSMKEYSPFGFVYSYLADNVPFVNTIFRFGDTKFHALVAFGGSIVAAAFLVRLLTFRLDIEGVKVSRRILIIPVVGLLLFSQIYVYRAYFGGNFVGFFMYQKIPDAYFQMAKIINSDPEMVRVVHMPLDRQAYWKPYSWGYFGSSFMHFMLNKPLFDRSFEPASMENAQIHQQLIDAVDMARFVPEDAMLEERATNLVNLLASLSVKYVIDDGTITPEVSSRNIRFWGDFDGSDSRRVFEYLAQTGRFELVDEYEVNPQALAKDYSVLYPYSQGSGFSIEEPQTIRLYTLTSYKSRIEIVSELDVVHTGQQLSLQDRQSLTNTYIQASQLDKGAMIYPFSSTDSTVDTSNNPVKLQLPIVLEPGEYVMEGATPSITKQTEQLRVYLSTDEDTITVHLEPLPFPSLSGARTENTSEKLLTFNKEYDDYRFLRIGEVVLPLGSVLSQEKTYLGSVIVRGLESEVGLLRKSNEYNLSQQLVQLEANPQCMDDALSEPTSNITGDNGVLVIAGQNVSNCLATSVALNRPEGTTFSILEFESVGSIEDLSNKADLDTGKPDVGEFVNAQENPLRMEICLWRDGENGCLGMAKTFELYDKTTQYVVPVVADLSTASSLIVGFRLRSGQKQSYETSTTNIKLSTFVEPETITYVRAVIQPQVEQIYQLAIPANIELTFPQATSNYTKQSNVRFGDVRFDYDSGCDEAGKDQTIKDGESGALMYVVGCRNFARQRINFSSENFYLWHANYKHLSGALPTLLLMDSQKTYFFHKLVPERPANDIFEIPLQDPESIYSKKPLVDEVIKQTSAYDLRGYIKPMLDISDEREKEMVIQYYSQNVGLVELRELSLIELPNYWSGSRIRPVEYQPLKFDEQATLAAYERILPSLWRVELDSTQFQESMILFNEQFDSKWKLFGADTQLHARCNGLTNCYQLNLNEGVNTLYIFYYPQVLTWIGMLIALLAVVSGWFIYRKINKSRLDHYPLHDSKLAALN